MPESTPIENIVISVTAGYREEQIRPFLASLQHFSPRTSLRLLVDRFNPDFMKPVRGWFPDCSFHLLPQSRLRALAVKNKPARSALKRLARWTGSQSLGKRLLGLNFLRHIVILDLLRSWNLDRANVLLCDSRDVVFQADPFGGEYPPLWTCEEDKRLEECQLNSFWFKRAGGDAALAAARHQPIVCAGVLGGHAGRVMDYLEQSSKIVKRLAPRITLTEGDQGIHNYLVRSRAELGFTVLPNGTSLAANVGYTRPSDLVIKNQQVRVRQMPDVPAVLHQYDRHPPIVDLVQARWSQARQQ